MFLYRALYSSRERLYPWGKLILSIQDVPLNRLTIVQFLESFFAELKKAGERTKQPHSVILKPFLDLVLSLKKETLLSIPLLLDLAILSKNPGAGVSGTKDRTKGAITRRIDRRYLRLCRVQEELGLLDFRNAPPGVSADDYIFSRIDFTRYREITEKHFETLFPEALTDFNESFLKKTFGLGRGEIQSVIEGSYKKTDGSYRMQRENPLILSIMRTMETSLENSPLFSAGEIREETERLFEFAGAGSLQGMELLYPLLVYSLNNVLIHHDDGMTTKLFISPQGDLSAVFRPADKPWTHVLIGNEELRRKN